MQEGLVTDVALADAHVLEVVGHNALVAEGLVLGSTTDGSNVTKFSYGSRYGN